MTTQCSISRLQIKKHKGDFRASTFMLALGALRPHLPQQVPAPSPARSTLAQSPQQLWRKILQPSSDGDQSLPTIFLHECTGPTHRQALILNTPGCGTSPPTSSVFPQRELPDQPSPPCTPVHAISSSSHSLGNEYPTTTTNSFVDTPPQNLPVFTPLLVFHRKQLGQQQTMAVISRTAARYQSPAGVEASGTFGKWGRLPSTPNGLSSHTLFSPNSR